ncbi:MAG: AMP-binding protein [Paracoccaceae bacterium]|jgi:long-chain acyl-CoA synthetase
MNPAEWLVRTAQISPSAPALLRGETIVADYATFAARAAAIGAALRDQYGVTAGDRIAVFMKNRTAYLEVLYGAWFVGAVVVPINAKLHAKEAAWIIVDADAELIFATCDVTAALSEALPQQIADIIDTDAPEFSQLYAAKPLAAPVRTKPDDMIWLFYTSGTTGKPKGVMISAGNLQAMTLAYFVDVDEVTSADAILYAAPMSHGAGLYNFMHVLRGARHVVPASGGFDPAEILSLAKSVGNVSMFAAPTMVRRLVDHAKNVGSVGSGIKTIVYGGGPMYLADIVEAVEVMGPRFVQIYGQGECPMTITASSRAAVADRSHPDWKARLASVGTAQCCVYVKIVDETGAEVPIGQIGEIIVQGPPVMLGYWRNAATTAKTIKDGWLWTGDMGAVDAYGFVTLHDRSKDVIISGGTNIYPREVEEALLLHPDVYEVAVVGREHPDWGEEVIAFVVLVQSPTVTEAELDSHCLTEIARFKRPKEYRLVNDLPKNNYGKILKTDLRERLEHEG